MAPGSPEPCDYLRAVEKEAAQLRQDKAALNMQLGDCQRRLESAQQQLQTALATQEAAQAHLDQLQRVSILPSTPWQAHLARNQKAVICLL